MDMDTKSRETKLKLSSLMLETFNTHRQKLFGIAYRMLGRVSEAEDMLQEVWLRWQKQELTEIKSPQAWLVSTMTRLCIDHLRLARHERETYYGVWLPEPLVLNQESVPSAENHAELADSLTTAFMLMLETLNPTERAVFLLREVFEYDYADTAAAVGKSEANCRQIVRRAKTQITTQTQDGAAPNEQARRITEQFFAATTSGEMGDLLALLMEDVTIYNDGGGKVKAAGLPIRTADKVSRFLIGIQRNLPADTRAQFAVINHMPGLLLLSQGHIYATMSFELAEGRVQNIYGVWNPEKLAHLGKAKLDV